MPAGGLARCARRCVGATAGNIADCVAIARIAASSRRWHSSAIMVARTQITLEPEYHRKARARAAELGISLAEYLRGLVARDLEGPRRNAKPQLVFDLGDSGESDVSRNKDRYLGEALSVGRTTRRTRARKRKP
jgi:hypothetical protein